MDALHETSLVRRFGNANYVASDALTRDQSQSTRLHEPSQILSYTDPITGRDVAGLAERVFLVDGNVSMYFESERTRQEYLDMPIDHPFHLVDNPTDEGYAEG